LAHHAREAFEPSAEALETTRSVMPPLARTTLTAQRMLIVASVQDGDVWASLLHGPPGFITVPDERTVLVRGGGPKIGPGPVGLLAIEPASRRRVRVCGTARLTREGLRVAAESVEANCPRSVPPPRRGARACPAGRPRESRTLTGADRGLITGTDGFFVATAAYGRASAACRAGAPGFVAVRGNRLTFFDEGGSAWYMRLGSVIANPRIGLLFLDWEAGETLQLTGGAELDLDSRAVHVTIERAVRTPGALPDRWIFSP
jgi:uncharacterized protein